MSTRSSWYYDGPIHIWHDVMDGLTYVSFNEETDRVEHHIPAWLARLLVRVLRLTGREDRHEAQHKALCDRLNWARCDAIRTAIRDIERIEGGAEWKMVAIAALQKTYRRWSDEPLSTFPQTKG